MSRQVPLQDYELFEISDLNWNGSSYAPPAVLALIHEQIQEQVKSQPQAEAVCAWDGSLSYLELDRLSSILARHLQHRFGVKPETFVPICFHKSKWNVVTMLAILKAGGAFVPMDPKFPTQRMEVIIKFLNENDKYAGVVLTSASLVEQLTELTHPLLKVDQQLLDALAKGSNDDELVVEVAKDPALTPKTAALVIFTSGSTGMPKGIIQEHRGFCSAAAAHGPALIVDNRSRVFQFAAHTFDVSLCDILTTLILGGCVCIPSEEERLNDLPGAIRRLRATHLHLTPTVATMIDPDDVPGVEVIILGGEALSHQVLGIWADKAHLIQAYGPAEAGVDCTVKQHVKKTGSPKDVGRPVGSSIWIVDEQNHDNLVPNGQVGELLIEGPILARGYLDDYETEQAFIMDPEWVSQLPQVQRGRRFYKTGDLGGYRFTGDIAIVGRKDTQIKIRGMRLELGEVETHLRKALGGDESVQVAADAVTPKGGGRLLAAFITVGGGSDGDGDGDDANARKNKEDDGLVASNQLELKKFRRLTKEAKDKLREYLPPYMVPDVFIPLREMPLSSSGKVERKTLCALAHELTVEELNGFTEVVPKKAEIIMPSTLEEEVLYKAWRHVLQIHDLSVEDNFFHLGGDSAKAMILISELRKTGFALSVADVNKNPVLKHLAPLVKLNADLPDVVPFSLVSDSAEGRASIRAHAAEVCGVHENQIKDAYPITEMQERFFVGAYLGAPGNNNTWVQRARDEHQGGARQLVFKTDIPINVRSHEQTWQPLARRHSILRTRFLQNNDEKRTILQVIVDEKISVASYEGQPLEEFLQKDRAEPMTWGSPLVRVSVNEQDKWMVITISHAIYDGMSLKMLSDEVAREFFGIERAEPKIHMGHWMKYLADRDRQSAIDFWRKDLADADVRPYFERELLLNRPTVQNVVRKQKKFLSGPLPPDAPSRATIVQVALAFALVRRLGTRDIIFDCHLSGRTGPLPGVGDLLAPTLTSLPVCVRFGNDPHASMLGIMRRTQEYMNKIVEHEHVGWWTLVQMDEFRHKLHGAPLLNIINGGGGGRGGGQGLFQDMAMEQQRTIAHNEAPFGMVATFLSDYVVELLVFSDGECVSPEEVESILSDWRGRLSDAWGTCVESGGDNLELGYLGEWKT